jgi:hypothetical protein
MTKEKIGLRSYTNKFYTKKDLMNSRPEGFPVNYETIRIFAGEWNDLTKEIFPERCECVKKWYECVNTDTGEIFWVEA